MVRARESVGPVPAVIPMGDVRLTDVAVDGRRVRYEFDATGEMRQFFWANDFFAEYGFPVEELPAGVLTIPWVANVAPIAWANGATLRVPVLDERFLDALEDLKESYRELYPRFMRGGDVVTGETARPDPQTGGDTNVGLLFSGGVDSLASFLGHREEEPLLISINGFDVRLHRDDAWEEKASLLRSFGGSHGLDNAFVTANIVGIHNMRMVRAHFRRFIDGNWFASVQAGVGLLGLAAPIAYHRNVETLYMASSLSEKYADGILDSFEPGLVDSVEWASTDVELDGYELTRQEKIELIAEHVRDGGEPFQIHTCLESEVGNCSECEKCARTAVGLAIAGLDPNEFGYDVDGRRLSAYRRRVESGAWDFDGLVAMFWRELQRASRDREQFRGDPEFFEWLVGADLDALVERTAADVPTSVARTIARNTPYQVYNSVLDVWRPLRRAVVAEG